MKFRISEIPRLWPIAKRRAGAAVISWVQWLFSDEKLVKDVFGKKHDRRALLCHLPETFKSKGKLPKYHSNFTECQVIAKCLDRLGFSVDCSTRANSSIDYSSYELICGINGNAFMNSFAADKKIQPLRIFYSVGAETLFNYRETALRNKDFHDRHGVWMLKSNRYIPGDPRTYYEASFSDAVICLGDEYIFSHFVGEDREKAKYRWLPAFYFHVAEPAIDKDFETCRRNILWFGSSGMIHKGLDIAIDFAVAHPQFTLHICGGNRQESDFLNYYRPIIESHVNIIEHGFVDIESEEFALILSQCGILLNPSVSEGGAVSVLNVLGNGALFPVYSKATGVDISHTGICVKEVTYEAFETALLQADSVGVDEFARKAWSAHRLVKENYTLESYENNMYMILKEIIEKKGYCNDK